MENIGNRLKLFAKHYGNASKLAIVLDMTPQSIASYINNKRKPGTEIMFKLSNLGCNINWLLTGEGDMLLGEDLDTSSSHSLSPHLDSIEEELKEIRKYIEMKKIK